MRIPIERLSDDAHIWIFGISPTLSEQQSATVLDAVDGFLENWAAHGAPIAAGSTLVDGSFLVVAADARSERSGCSIDRMFGIMRSLEQHLGASILDGNRIFFRRDDGAISAVPRSEFRARAANGEISLATPVFDTIADRLGDIRSGNWERPASDSWHRDLISAR